MTARTPTFASLASATRNYAVRVEGDALAPRFADGQLVAVRPAVNADPATLAPRSLVLAVTALDPAQPRRFSRPALFTLNADRDLIGGRTVIGRGSFVILGVVLTKRQVTP